MSVMFDLLLIAIVAPIAIHLYGRKHQRWSRTLQNADGRAEHRDQA